MFNKKLKQLSQQKQPKQHLYSFILKIIKKLNIKQHQYVKK